MFVSLNWLNSFVDIKDDVKTFTDKMTLTGTKVEGWENKAEGMSNIVVAKVTQIERHPDSDHMFVTKVDDGTNVYQVVTGAQNVHQGDIVPFARDNSYVYGGKHIKTGKLRGIESQGMLCSAEELGIEENCIPKNTEEGIFILSKDAPLGMDIFEYLGRNDTVVEFELTNNRQDCNSILGIAYEASATYGEGFKFPDYIINDTKDEISDKIKVEIEDYSICKRYTGRLLKINKIEDSPIWMQARLMNSGIRPINNIVDVSNYVMLEIGQPLHTFDFDKVEGGKITVRLAKEDDKIVTLDGQERTLDANTIVIDDAKRHVAIGGVMGAENSDIDENSKYVFIEAANFNKNLIRATAKKLGLRSEASAHFEKGISETITRYACDRAASLLVEMGACELIEGVVDVYDTLPVEKTLSIDTDWYNQFTGIELTPDEICSYLNRLNFNAKAEGRTVTVTVPVTRQDVYCEEDLAEDVTRMYGYEKLPMTLMPSSSYISLPNQEFAFQTKLKNILISAGGYETLTYSFISPNAIKALGMNEDDIRSNPVIITNAYGEEYSAMRTTLLCNLVDTLSLNHNRKNQPKMMFEVSNVYLQEGSILPEHVKKVIFGRIGSDFYYIKSVLTYIFEKLDITGYKFERSDENYMHPGRSANVILNGKKIGYLGQLHPVYAEKCDLPEETYVCEIDYMSLYEEVAKMEKKYVGSSKYPMVSRDLALVMDEQLLSGEVEDIITANAGKYLIKLAPFDVYRSAALGENKKSIAYTLNYRSDTETLPAEVINESIDNILKALADKGIVIRA